VHVQSQENERSCLCVSGISILLISTIFVLYFRNVLTVRNLLFFHFNYGSNLISNAKAKCHSIWPCLTPFSPTLTFFQTDIVKIRPHHFCNISWRTRKNLPLSHWNICSHSTCSTLKHCSNTSLMVFALTPLCCNLNGEAVIIKSHGRTRLIYLLHSK
jgi:hypothetical protein